MNKEVLEKVKMLPTNPGVYIMEDIDGIIIYVGKAKNLKNRVTQYFRNGYKTEKVAKMVSNINNFRYIITNSEIEALLLENNLIKKHKPKYNILLKDDKSYPYIKINVLEDFPCLEIIRKVKKDGSKYFGPFMIDINIYDVINLIKQAFKIRPCNYKISKDSKKRECLDYHIGNCLAPCSGACTIDEYRLEVEKVIRFLKGDDGEIESILKEKMMEASNEEKFEQALVLRDSLKTLEKLKARKNNVLDGNLIADFISIYSDDVFSVISIINVRNGRLLGAKSYQVESLADTDSERLRMFTMQYYSDESYIPKEIYFSDKLLEIELLEEYLSRKAKEKIDIKIPKIGDKLKLIEMAEKNSKDYLVKQISNITKKEDLTINACEDLKKILNLRKYPKRMECYDISHISGTDKVGSMVVFTDGAPDKKEYRKFKIKTVEGNNDFASLKEVLYRRLVKLGTSEEEKFPRPDLIVIDGGKGQLSSVLEVFRELEIDIDVISLAEEYEEIFVPNRSESILLDRSSYALRLLQRIRDEAHRFAITANREMRGKRSVSSLLEKIDGLGKKKRDAIIASFNSFDEIKSASIEELSKIDGIGKVLAKKIVEYIHEN